MSDRRALMNHSKEASKLWIGVGIGFAVVIAIVALGFGIAGFVKSSGLTSGFTVATATGEFDTEGALEETVEWYGQKVGREVTMYFTGISGTCSADVITLPAKWLSTKYKTWLPSNDTVVPIIVTNNGATGVTGVIELEADADDWSIGATSVGGAFSAAACATFDVTFSYLTEK